MKQLIRNLDYLSRYYDKKYDLNCGGCCWFAYEVARLCKKHNIKYKISINDYYDDIRDYIKDLVQLHPKHKGEGVSHMWIKLYSNGKYYGVNASLHTPDYTINLTPIELKHFYDNNNWNTRFRDNHRNAILKAVRDQFNDYKIRNYGF